MKKLLSLCLAFLLIFVSASFCTPVSAASSDTDAQIESTFVVTTPEKYEELVSILRNGSAEAKAEVIDYIFSISNNDVATCSWNDEYTIDVGDGTHRRYGFVSYTDSTLGMSIRTVVPAVLRGSSQYGYTWESVDASGAGSYAGSGSYTYEGNVSASIATTQQLYIFTNGTYTISKESAVSLGINLELLDYSHTTGSTMYYRYLATGHHVEYSPVKVG